MLSLVKTVFRFCKMTTKHPHPNTPTKAPLRPHPSSSLMPAKPKNNLSQFDHLSLKDFSLETKNASLSKNRNEQYWLEVGEEFLSRLEPTTNPHKIRSYSVILYNISKTMPNINLGNLEATFSMLLPFASAMSFTSIVSSLSRMGAFNDQLTMVVRRMYEKSKDRLPIRERVTINYSLVKNGDVMDKELLNSIEAMNLKELVTMMRMADDSGLMTEEDLGRMAKHFGLRKREMNVLDLAHGLEIFGKYGCLPEELESALSYAYKFVKKNIDAPAMERIWRHFPSLVNDNLLKISLVQQIALTLKILYRRG